MTDSKAARRQAIENYKQRDPNRGIFAVKCAPTGDTWVGHAPDLDAIRNRTWFTLRLGSHGDRALQAAWKAHGEDAFTFEVLEALPADTSAALAAELLKEKKRDWAARLGAGVLLV
ncbi:MAG: GIY-YIG nuclease family protein [Vicinamibacterales bacterium]